MRLDMTVAVNQPGPVPPAEEAARRRVQRDVGARGAQAERASPPPSYMIAVSRVPVVAAAPVEWPGNVSRRRCRVGRQGRTQYGRRARMSLSESQRRFPDVWEMCDWGESESETSGEMSPLMVCPGLPSQDGEEPEEDWG